MSSMTLAMLLTLKDLASGPLGEFQEKLQKTSQNLMAVGSTAMETGKKILGMLEAPVAAFEEAEDAALRLDAAMMGADNKSHHLFTAMKKHAVDLGNELPGTARELQMMFAALIKEGVSAEDILGGVGRATGSLAVITEMGFSETAKFAGQVSKSIGIAAKDMMPFMDTIQKAFHLGLSPTEIGYAFDKAAGAFNKFKIKGLESANELVPVLATLIKSGGMSAETAGTNFAAYMNGLYELQMGTDKSTKKLRANLKSLGVDFDIFEKDRTFKGMDKMMAMLDKIRTLDVNVQNAVAKELFGAGADSSIFEILSATGSKGIEQLNERIEKQANLTARIEKILTSFKNVKESAMGAWETLLAGVGESIGPELKAVADGFGALSEKILVFTQSHPQLTKWLTIFTILSGVTLVLGGGLIFGLGVMINMLATIGGALPIAVTFLSTKFMHLFSTFLKIGAWNTATGVRLTTWAGSLFPRAVTFVSTKFMHLYSTLLKVGQWIVAAPRRLFLWFKSIPTQFAAMMSRVGAGARALGPGLASFFGGLGRAMLSVGRAGMFALRHPLKTLGSLVKLSWSAITGGLRAVMLGLRGISMAALSNPIGAIIAVLVVAAVLVYKYWQPIKGFFKGLWQGLKVGLQPLGPAFKVAFGPLMPLIRPIIGAVKSVWNWFKNLLKPVNDVGNNGQKMGVRVGLALARIINKGVEVVAFFTGLVAKFFTWGSEMMSGLANGISSAAGKVMGKIKEIGGQIKSTFTGLLGIKSPSRVFMGYGQMLGAGLQLGMDSSAANILKASQRMSKAATPELNINKSGGFSGPGSPGMGGSGGMQITFAPNISLQPGSPAAQQVQEVMPLLYEEFKRMMRQYEHDRNRSFA